MSTVRLSHDGASQVAGAHEAAAARIEGAAGSAPGSVDGGEGATYLYGILAGVCGTGADLATLGNLVGAQVTATSEDFASTDSQVGDQLVEMTEAAR